MPNRCIVAGCSRTPKDDVSLHRFPKDENLRKIWIAKVKLTRADWHGPSEWSTICSNHFAEDDFEDSGLYSSFGMKEMKRKLKDSAIPMIRLGVQSSKKQDVPIRSAAEKRERKRILEEALSGSTSSSQDLSTPSSVPASDSVDEPGCSHWSGEIEDAQEGSSTSIELALPSVEFDFETDFFDEPACSYWIMMEKSMSLNDVHEQPETDTRRFSHESSAAKRRVATRTRGTQVKPVRMRDRGSQYDPPQLADPSRTKGTMCNIPEEEKAEQEKAEQERAEKEKAEQRAKEEEMMEVENLGNGKSDEEETSSDKKKQESSDYKPESSESSSDYQSTPQKPRKRLCKSRVGRSPAVAVKPGVVRPHPQDEKKYVVFEGNLLKLLQRCQDCHSGNVLMTKREDGTMLVITTECVTCGKTGKWESQPYFERRPAGNILLAASLLFAGGSWAKLEQVLGHMKVACFSEQTFYDIQRTILQPAIEKKWVLEQGRVITKLQEAGVKLTLAGDGRADSPGHSAKYGVYTGLETRFNKIVDLELVQSNEVKSSYHMELEGFKRLEAFLASNGLEIGKLITDRHRQLAKHVRENSPSILHAYDVWHLAKAVQKKVHALAKQKNCEDLLVWERSITNHVYWVASSTKDEEGDLREAKWGSLVNHIQNKHEGHSDLFPACLHGNLEGERPKNWLKPHTMVTEKLEDIILSTVLVKDIKKMSSGDQTSSLESFHGVINQFAPKMRSYKYHGMLSRLHLAALHFNENSDRKQATKKDGEGRYAISKPKYKPGAASAKAVKEGRTYTYVVELMADIAEYDSNATPPARQPSPPPLISGHVYPPREEIIQQHHSRFASSNQE